jgi:hypothetical protein
MRHLLGVAAGLLPCWSEADPIPCPAIAHCRTTALGGHIEACEDCGQRRIAYNFCRNRHCPKCQGAAARPSNLPFETLDNIFMTPHMSGWTWGTIERRQRMMARLLITHGDLLRPPRMSGSARLKSPSERPPLSGRAKDGS